MKQARASKGRGKRNEGFKTKKEAQAAMVEAENALNKGTYVEPSKMTVADFMQSWLESKRQDIPSTKKQHLKITNVRRGFTLSPFWEK
ncbi:hypothetical protein QJ48_10340 [Paenibacillus sp. A3]|uniref:Arm DNA-binding domain-containing protein n=1 Tax=Paenibacillus sp. A3 TaxID=1337054 RepID=UPI0006E55E75|nr:Arm DNA-binding domain-containing protein [Paenibacillus sp. A3]KPV59558.1 hypothetical protein QJ48_10340 [Paenibacillus sp. A3]